MLGTITIATVAQVHAFLGRAPPRHPHVTVIGASWQPPMTLVQPIEGYAIRSEVFAVSLKRGDECRLAFGRQVHDAQAGTIAFLSPGQTLTPLVPLVGPTMGELSWTLIFHPELMSGAAHFRDHAFLRYSSEEALHLTDDEQETLTGVIRTIEREACATPDSFSNDVLAAQLTLFFTYCRRFYARQFQTRTEAQGRVLGRLLRHLDEYWASERAREAGLPTVAGCARALGFSPDYLSDLLRVETGESARDHLHRALIEVAKRRLASSSARISEVAFGLGFDEPQHFSRLFKQKTGASPSDWRAERRRTEPGPTARVPGADAEA